jgi:hypothetical protein
MALTPAAAGGRGTFTVVTQTGCTWSSSTSTSWITVSGSGTGSGSASYTIGVNGSAAGRNGTILVAGRTASVTQAQKAGPVPPKNMRVVTY